MRIAISVSSILAYILLLNSHQLSACIYQDKLGNKEMQDKIIEIYNAMQFDISKIINSKKPIKEQVPKNISIDKIFSEYLESKMLFTEDKYLGAFLALSRIGYDFNGLNFQDLANSYDRVLYYSFCAPTYYNKMFENSKNVNMRLALSAVYHCNCIFNTTDQAKIANIKQSIYDTLNTIKSRMNGNDNAIYKNIDYLNKYVAGIAEIGIDKYVDILFSNKLKPGSQYVVLNIDKQDAVNYLNRCDSKKLCGSDTTVIYFSGKAENGKSFSQYMLMVHGTECIDAKEVIPSQSDRAVLNMINGIVVRRSRVGNTSIQLLLTILLE